MPKFIVNVREVYVQMVEIEASSKEDAIRRVEDGQGRIIEQGPEFSHTLATDTWTVDLVEP